MVDLKSQYQSIKSDIDKAIIDVLESTAFHQWQACAGFHACAWPLPRHLSCDTVRQRHRCLANCHDGAWP